MFVHRNNCCCQKKRGSYVGIENIRGKSFLEQSKSGKGSPCACGSIGRFEPAIWQ